MLGSWILYALVVAGLFAAAALPVDRALRAGRRPTRWVWLGAMGASVLVPALSLVLAGRIVEEPGLLGPVSPVAAPVMAGLGEVSSAMGSRAVPLLERIEAPLVRLWAVATMVLGGLLAGGALRLHAVSRRWSEVTVNGTEVLASEEMGPAVLGFFRHRIVMPRWAMESEPGERAWILAHEREHAEAHDPTLVFGAALLAVLLPWNLPLWWQLWRLRLAVEVDCDARVLRGSTVRERALYGELLLEAGRRISGRVASLSAVAAFAERTSGLERRLQELARSGRPPLWRLGGLLAGGALLVGTACMVPAPMAPDMDEEEAETERAETRADEPGSLRQQPVFTPFTRAPDVINREEVQRALEEEYPAELRDAGIGGTASVHFFIDAEGRVRDTRLNESSGHAELDQAAIEVASVIRFTPALNRDEPTPVWISLPITFQTRPARPAPPAERDGGPEEPGGGTGDVPGEPGFTPYEVAPDVMNAAEVREALVREYPPVLRDAGVGGTAQVHLYITARGRVASVRIDRSSGHEALDDAALRVAEVVRFSPALRDGEPVAVWISLPFTFQVR